VDSLGLAQVVWPHRVRTKQPKVLYRARNEKRPKQEIPTEAARIKARMTNVVTKLPKRVTPSNGDPKLPS
jgi:hypothetical protein